MEVIQSGRGNLIQQPDLNAFREWNRQKSKVLVDKRITEAEAVSRFIKDGDYIDADAFDLELTRMSLALQNKRPGLGFRSLRLITRNFPGRSAPPISTAKS